MIFGHGFNSRRFHQYKREYPRGAPFYIGGISLEPARTSSYVHAKLPTCFDLLCPPRESGAHIPRSREVAKRRESVRKQLMLFSLERDRASARPCSSKASVNIFAVGEIPVVPPSIHTSKSLFIRDKYVCFCFLCHLY